MNAAYMIVAKIQEAGHEAVFAGGCVRDMIMKQPPHDYDIATSAKPDEVEALFENTIPIGKQFGVVTVVMNGNSYEVATFRADGFSTDNRRPDSIEFCSIEEDAKRRDLTINGMFYDPVAKKLHDFVGGQHDIQQRMVKFIGDPASRIKEDHLRMLRAIRFASRFNYSMEFYSALAIHNNASKIASVSIERIRDELIKMVLHSNRANALNHLEQIGILEHVLPEVHAMAGCEQNAKWHPEGDVFNHTVAALKCLDDTVGVVETWATLLHDVGKPVISTEEDGVIRAITHDTVGAKMAETILRRLKFPNDEIEKIVGIVKDHMKIKHCVEFRNSTLNKYMISGYFDELMKVSLADSKSGANDVEWHSILQDRIKTFKVRHVTDALNTVSPLVNGDDLIAIGYTQGKALGAMLKTLHQMQLDNEIHSKEDGCRYAKNILTQ